MDSIVSAIVTTRNRPDLCILAVKSILEQSYKNIEIVVVDDASDETSRIKLFIGIQNLSQSIIYHYIDKENSRGGNYARNLGVSLSKGDYVAFLDDDDSWMPEKIEKQLNLIKDNSNCSVVCCGRIFVYDDGNQKSQKQSELISGDLSQRIFTSMPYTTSSFFIERNYFEKVGKFDENLKYWQDYELLIRLCQSSEICVPEELLLSYRVNLSDKNRVTNNIDGWFDAVDYINAKHSKLIDALPQSLKMKRNSMIAQDASKRLSRVGRKTEQKKYLKIAFQNEKTLKNFIKYVFNISKIRG